jgi:hypothetical protein
MTARFFLLHSAHSSVPIVCWWFLVAMSTASASPFSIKLISGLAVFAIDRDSAAIMKSICGDVDLTAPTAAGAAAGAGAEAGSDSGSMASASSLLDNSGFASESCSPLVGAVVEMAAGAAGGSGSGTDRGSLTAESKAAAGAGSGADSAAGSSARAIAGANALDSALEAKARAADADEGDNDDEASGGDEDDNDNSPQYYAMTFALAKFLRVTDGAIAQCITRALPTFQTWVTTLRFHDCKTDDQRRLFARVKATFGEIKSLLENAVDSENWTKSDRFNLYPLPLIAKLCAHYCPKRLPVADLEAVREFLKAHAAPPLPLPSEEKGMYRYYDATRHWICISDPLHICRVPWRS